VAGGEDGPSRTLPTSTVRLAVIGIHPTIAYAATVDGNTDLYIWRDGKPARVTRHPAVDQCPAWSPDGTKIAFESDRDGNFEIYVADADGSNQRRLTRYDGFDGHCTWAPNGKQIAFERSSGKLTSRVCVMNADGSSVHPLTAKLNARQPDWSPDGSKIAFAAVNGPGLITSRTEFQLLRDKGALGEDIYMVDLDGSHRRRVTNDLFENRCPRWSPDGKKIAFASNRGGKRGAVGVMQIYVSNVDGSDRKPLTNLDGQSLRPTWSPDGKWIAFDYGAMRRGNRFPVHDILAVAVEESRLIRVISGVDDYCPAWRPIDGPRHGANGPTPAGGIGTD